MVTSTRRTANVALLLWGILTVGLVIAIPGPPLTDRSWLDTTFLILVAVLLGTANIRLAYGSINMSGAAVCAAIATVSPLQAALIGFAGQLLHSWDRRRTDLIPSNLGQAFWGAFGASLRIVSMRFGAPDAVAISLALFAAVVANVLSTSIALSIFHSTPALRIMRQAVNVALLGAYGYFVVAAALAATMLNGTPGGIVRASGLFVMAIAVGDSVGGRSIRDFLERQLVAAEPHIQYGQLAQGTFHDLRNLISTALIHLQSLAQTRPTEERESLGIALAAIEDARDLLSDAQETGRISSWSQFRRVDLAQLCDRIAALHRQPASLRKVHLLVRMPQDEPAVFGHPVLLGEVLSNLILNAIDATDRGGTIVIECATDARAATVTVTDSGAGIPGEIAGRIFEPGFTTKPGTGSGLGLYMALGIARQHHGDLALARTGANGTCFELVLPRFDIGRAALTAAGESQDAR